MQKSHNSIKIGKMSVTASIAGGAKSSCTSRIQSVSSYFVGRDSVPDVRSVAELKKVKWPPSSIVPKRHRKLLLH